ncbi:capsular biosynthesis protein [Bdellovibrio sp. HCB209]|uniref:capsular biosynthesis protein n=1 Tax=Bdellovibrio sp. HCB209 TaxID=3394354 RepID=UPI0039B4A225
MNKPDKTLIFDVDGTICPIKKVSEKYEDLIPDQEMIVKIRELKNDGWRIVFHTARNMKTYSGNLGLINANTLPLLVAWLKKWDIPFDEIYCGKPWPGSVGYYVDDRAIRPRELLEHSFEEIEDILKRDRMVHAVNSEILS